MCLFLIIDGKIYYKSFFSRMHPRKSPLGKRVVLEFGIFFIDPRWIIDLRPIITVAKPKDEQWCSPLTMKKGNHNSMNS